MFSSSMQRTLNSISPEFKKILVSNDYYYELPPEIWQMVLLYMSPIDLHNFMFCNKTFLKIVLSHVHSLSFNFIYRLPDPEQNYLFKVNYTCNSRLEENVTFISLMNCFKFASSSVLERIYNDNRIMLSSAKDNTFELYHLQYLIDASQPVTLYNASIRYALLKHFYPGELKMNETTFYLIKFAHTDTFYKLFVILLQVPSVLSDISVNTLTDIHNFFSRWPVSFTIEKCIYLIKYVSNFGGHPGKALNHLSFNRYKIYLNSLVCGVQEPHANFYASSRFSLSQDLLLTFKAIVPIVGYYYAKCFVLDKIYNFDDYPYFLQIASRLNSRNIFNFDKCIVFSKTGADLEKFLSLRNKKRKLL